MTTTLNDMTDQIGSGGQSTDPGEADIDIPRGVFGRAGTEGPSAGLRLQGYTVRVTPTGTDRPDG